MAGQQQCHLFPQNSRWCLDTPCWVDRGGSPEIQHVRTLCNSLVMGLAWWAICFPKVTRDRLALMIFDESCQVWYRKWVGNQLCGSRKELSIKAQLPERVGSLNWRCWHRSTDCPTTALNLQQNRHPLKLIELFVYTRILHDPIAYSTVPLTPDETVSWPCFLEILLSRCGNHCHLGASREVSSQRCQSGCHAKHNWQTERFQKKWFPAV